MVPSAVVNWLGLAPFFLVLALFLFVPAVGVFVQALHNADGSVGFESMREAITGQNLDAFFFSFTFSLGAALVGTILGFILTYTIILHSLGWNVYGGDFSLGSVSGLIVVYSYFNIPLMVLVSLAAVENVQASWREACASLGGGTITYWRRIALPILSPALTSGFLLLFVNSFSAYATARALTDNSKIVPLRIGFFLSGDIKTGTDSVGFALAAWMIIVMGVSMIVYWFARRRTEQWLRA